MIKNHRKIPHIVIVGGGAGGLELAIRLGHQLGKSGQAVIQLVDVNLTHLWKPLWHEVAAGTLDSHADEFSYISLAKQHHFQFIYGELQSLNRQQQQIILNPIQLESPLLPSENRVIDYDFLILAIGSISNDFNTPGCKEHCLFIDSRTQADYFQQHFIRLLLQYQNQTPSGNSKLTIAIIGGGATGVELAAELHDAIQQSRYYGLHQLDIQQGIQITLIEGNNRLLAGLPERLSIAVRQQLEKMGIIVYTNQRVTQITADGLTTQQGLFIPATLKVWAAGIKAPAILNQLDGLETNNIQQLIVKSTLQTTRDEHIFAIGDCASCPWPNHNTAVPARAQAAHQQAKLLTKSLVRYLNHKPLLTFQYRDYGSLVTLSQQNTVGSLMGRLIGQWFIQGKLARLFYLSLYKMHQMLLLGTWQASLLTLARWLTKRVRPRLKLH